MRPDQTSNLKFAARVFDPVATAPGSETSYLLSPLFRHIADDRQFEHLVAIGLNRGVNQASQIGKEKDQPNQRDQRSQYSSDGACSAAAGSGAGDTDDSQEDDDDHK